MKAREIMTSNPECLTTSDTVEAAARLMRDRDIGLIPVVDDRTSMTLRGVITDRDITVRHVASGDRDDCRVADHMSEGQVHSVRPDDDVKQVMEVMRRQQVRRVPVCEDGDRLVGIIAQADVATEGHDDKATGRVVAEISEPGRPRG
jgi:CBS domain-containing protein